MDLDNFRTQIRKGYLELCILLLIESEERLYGFEILDRMEKAELPVKEGTLYPMLNRMTQEGTLTSVWETENLKGHPRKFYSLTKGGKNLLAGMKEEFEKLSAIYRKLLK